MAQVEIAIAVKDEGTGSAVASAPVWLSTPGYGVLQSSDNYFTTTDNNGLAWFKKVEVGSYDLSIQARRFKHLEVTGVEVREGSGLHLDGKGQLVPPGTVIKIEGSLPTVKLTPLDELLFNGSKLCWLKGNKKTKCWPAVSGRKNYQTGIHQKKKDRGPLPEGLWHVKQSRYQKMGNRSNAEKLAAELGRTAWPGGESSWGRHRIWLDPADGTETYRRSGFSIHGGDDPGSAGCVDLTNSLEKFIIEFRKHKRDMLLEVVYD